MYSDAQKRADRNWREKNREKASYLRSRSSAKSFIKNKAEKEDLEMLKEIIEERLKG